MLNAIRAGAPQDIALPAIIQVARHHEKIIREAIEIAQSRFVYLRSRFAIRLAVQFNGDPFGAANNGSRKMQERGCRAAARQHE